MEWQMTEAKNRLGWVMKRANSEEPQVMRRRKDAFGVLSEGEYERLRGKRLDFKEYLMQDENSDGLNLSRDQSLFRDVDARGCC